jgi:subtilase family serine protease
LDGQVQSIGGTSGATPFAAAQFALLSAQQRLAGRPRIGFVNPWLYQLYEHQRTLFYDVGAGSNDLDNVGCCTSNGGFDYVTGLGVPNLGEIAKHIAPPAP